MKHIVIVLSLMAASMGLTACVVEPGPVRGRVVVDDGWHNHHCWRCW